MSRHYISTKQAVISGEQTSLQDILKKLAAKRPALAKQLAGVDWNAIIMHVSRKALESAAAACGATFSKTYDRSSRYADGSEAKVRGQILGVLRDGQGSDGMQLGLALDGTQLSFIWNSHRYEDGASGRNFDSGTRDAWKQAIQKAYLVEATAAMLGILGGQVARINVHGATVLQTQLRGGAR